MTSAGLGAPAAASARVGEAALHEPQDERVVAAWLSAIPCVGLVALAAWLLGPLLGELTPAGAGGFTFTPQYVRVVRPEPTEHARYLIALTLPLAISLAVCTSPRWLSRISLRALRPGSAIVQALLAAIVGACYVAQIRFTFGAVYTEGQGTLQMRYFTAATLLAAAAVAGATVAVLWNERLRALAGGLLRDSRAKRLAVLALVVLATALWLSHAVETDRTLANAPFDMRFNFAFTLDETFALLNGLTPLVDFTAQYGSLWPYVLALPMLTLGKSVLVFSIAACTISGLALLSIYSVLRRTARSSVGALLLYLPFLATSLFSVFGTAPNYSTVGTYYAIFPLRYTGPFFLALLTARLIERGVRPLAVYVLFVVGGLTILNNLEFGIAALGASVAAIAWAAIGTSHPPRRLRLALVAGAGLATALALVCLLTLVRAGSLPQLHRLTDFTRLFAVAGFAMMPLPGLLGLHLVVYLTHVGAIVVGTVRAVRRERDRLLTGMLVWAGVFGLGTGTYYVGRSHPTPLKFLFSAWALTLALLTIVVVRDLARRRQLSIAAVLVLLGFGVAACSLAQLPTPWGEAARFDSAYLPIEESDNGPRPLAPPTSPTLRRFVATIADGPHRFVYKRGAPVAILLRTGHRIADAYGVRNVSPYTGAESTPTTQRVEAVLDALARAGGNTLILPNPIDGGIFPLLERRGFRLLTHHGLDRYDPTVPHSDAVMHLWPYNYVIKWVDTRHLHPRALQSQR